MLSIETATKSVVCVTVTGTTHDPRRMLRKGSSSSWRRQLKARCDVSVVKIEHSELFHGVDDVYDAVCAVGHVHKQKPLVLCYYSSTPMPWLLMDLARSRTAGRRAAQ